MSQGTAKTEIGATEIDAGAVLWDNWRIMNEDLHDPLSDTLRRAIVESGIPFLTLEQRTGVTRASIARFVSGKRSMRLDLAGRLAAYFGLELRPIRRKKG